MGHVTQPRPRDLTDLDRAGSAGVTPVVSSTPPPVTVIPTARRALRDRWLTVGGAALAVAVAMIAGADNGRLSLGAVVTMLVVAAAGVIAMIVTTRRWGRAQLAELQLGYTTTRFVLGRWWFAPAPDAPLTLGKIQWDWSGTWVLDPDGTVISAPSPDVDPPGLYPSPNRPGAVELWTGHQWSGYFPDT